MITPPAALKAVQQALEAEGIEIESAELSRVPKTTVLLETSTAKRVLGLVDALEELDDIQDVYANFDIPDEVLTAIA